MAFFVFALIMILVGLALIGIDWLGKHDDRLAAFRRRIEARLAQHKR